MATRSITFPTSAVRSTLKDIPIPLPPDAYTLFCEHEITNNRTLDELKDNKARLNLRLAELWAQARDSKPPSELASKCLEKAESMLKAYFKTFLPPTQKSRVNQLGSDTYATAQAADCGGALLLGIVLKRGFRPNTVTAAELWRNMTTPEKAVFKDRERLRAFHYAMCEVHGFQVSERDFAEVMSFMPRTLYARHPHSEASKAYWKC
jgi:hypothetical protein